ncbi:hypothetical protein D0911_02255 [Zhongshania marina]|uniref:Uncharacterized protein n=1 Tax=Zhongshania marina TaxID=2304603 RepID=A0ABX9W5Z6_9GAMM|nr:hypothetical protein D0911_02255 [Zhongshania marina]
MDGKMPKASRHLVMLRLSLAHWQSFYTAPKYHKMLAKQQIHLIPEYAIALYPTFEFTEQRINSTGFFLVSAV